MCKQVPIEDDELNTCIFFFFCLWRQKKNDNNSFGKGANQVWPSYAQSGVLPRTHMGEEEN